MVIKCGRKEIKIGVEDWILFNGACYQIMSTEETYAPKIAISKAKQLIKSGLIYEVFPQNPSYKGNYLKYYKFQDCDIII